MREEKNRHGPPDGNQNAAKDPAIHKMKVLQLRGDKKEVIRWKAAFEAWKEGRTSRVKARIGDWVRWKLNNKTISRKDAKDAARFKHKMDMAQTKVRALKDIFRSIHCHCADLDIKAKCVEGMEEEFTSKPTWRQNRADINREITRQRVAKCE